MTYIHYLLFHYAFCCSLYYFQHFVICSVGSFGVVCTHFPTPFPSTSQHLVYHLHCVPVLSQHTIMPLTFMIVLCTALAVAVVSGQEPTPNNCSVYDGECIQCLESGCSSFSGGNSVRRNCMLTNVCALVHPSPHPPPPPFARALLSLSLSRLPCACMHVQCMHAWLYAMRVQ